VTILAFYNIKGGVGKTAACVNLAYLAAAGGAATLLCDLDPQGAASFYFRISAAPAFDGRKFLKGGRKIAKNIKGTDFEGLDLLPSDLSFRHLDLLLDDRKRPRRRLGELLRPLADAYRYIFLDCPPNITLVSENVFRAADAIFVPVIPTVLALRTFDQLHGFFRRKGYDPGHLHPFLSMVEQRKRLHRELARDPELRERGLLGSAVPYLAAIEQMGLYRQPLTHRHPSSPGAAAYRALWEEMQTVLAARPETHPEPRRRK